MTAHTPGPWTLNETKHSGANVAETWIYDSRADQLLARVISDSKTQEANARLIAAAPDMLEALQAIAEADGQPDEVLQMAMIRARAVLAEINQE